MSRLDPYILFKVRMLTVILLGVLLQTLAFGVSTPLEICYVRTPDTPFSDCPHQPCLTLHQYTQTNNFNYSPISAWKLHSSRISTEPNNVSNITLRGTSNSATNIICTNVITIQCENVTGLKIEELSFIINDSMNHKGN